MDKTDLILGWSAHIDLIVFIFYISRFIFLFYLYTFVRR